MFAREGETSYCPLSLSAIMVAFGRLDQQHDHAFVARARAFFEDPTDQGISQYIRRSNQRMLQGKYKQIFNKVTTSNNNKWLRRKLLEATGLYEEAETVGTSAGKKREHRVTNSASSRQPGKRSKSPLIGKREATTAQSGQTNPAPEVTEGEARTSRQLKRPVKPKRVDHLPTGKEALSGRPKYGEEIVGRRVCIYWEQEGQFFAGEVSNFHSRRGQHKIDYDDGDVEHVVLDQESFFFEDDPQEQMDNTLLSQKRLQDRHTLSVNDVVWVRARGHGFWPGQIKAIFPDHGSVGSARVKLFEGSETEVSMRDIADFEEHFDSLSQAKTNASFIDAVKKAQQAHQEHAGTSGATSFVRKSMNWLWDSLSGRKRERREGSRDPKAPSPQKAPRKQLAKASHSETAPSSEQTGLMKCIASLVEHGPLSITPGTHQRERVSEELSVLDSILTSTRERGGDT